MWHEEFRIYGVPRVKKNSRVIIRNRRTGLPQIIPSKQATGWQRLLEEEIGMQWKSRKTYDQPVWATFIFYMPNRRQVDLSNLLQAPEDALEAVGVIENDRLIHSLDGSRKRIDIQHPRVEIWLRPFDG